jgi:hypothetical protein
VNPAVGLAFLALCQLGLAWLAGLPMTKIDRAVFVQQVKSYEPLGIKDFFITDTTGDERGEKRRAEVLRLVSLAPAARATVTALVVTFAGLVATGFVVGFADPSPDLGTVRVIASGAGAVVAFVAVFLLLIKIGDDSLRLHAPGELPIDGWTISKGFQRYRTRLRSGDVLTRYLSVAVLCNAVAIVVAAGV